MTDVDLNSSYGARAIGGANINESFLLYAHAGLTALDFDVRNSYTFAPPVTNASYSETGASFGFGANYKISNSPSIFAEYTKVVGVDFDGIPEIAGGTGRVNPNTLSLNSASLGIKFVF